MNGGRRSVNTAVVPAAAAAMARPAIRPGAPHRAATRAAYTTHTMPDDADPAGPDLDQAGPDEADADLTAALAQAQRGDADAFRALYRDTQPRLLRYLHALVSDDAEDIASETWLHITRDLHTFTGTYDNFRGWAATIARHRALDHLRRHARRPPPLLVPAEDLATLAATDDTATTAIDAVATNTALALINTLPPDQAEAVLLRAVLGLDATRAATVLGKRPGAVRTAAYRGLRTLARMARGSPEVTSTTGATQTKE
jgi:RNA polymerase sigma-70 factor, ECF subfamily